MTTIVTGNPRAAQDGVVQETVATGTTTSGTQINTGNPEFNGTTDNLDSSGNMIPLTDSQLQNFQNMANSGVSPGNGGGGTVADALSVAAGAGDLNANTNAGLGTAEAIVNDPSSFLTPEMQLSNSVPEIDVETGLVDGADDKFQMDIDGKNVDVATADATTITDTPENQGANTYEAVSSIADIEEAQGEAASGEVRDEAIIEAEQVDNEAFATGYNSDGTVNQTGKALTQFASQNISTVIDTSTVSGKLLAQQLGEGNYIDAKATAMGQLDIISQQFVGPNGEPKIPSWAQGTARNVSRIAAFKGVSGTAAMEAMSTAIMEATLPLAQEEARFYQTLTIENLDNKQEMTINRANVLSKMEQLNLDARMQTAITNSKNFMQMDLANLDNEQQMSVVNTQARVQSILEDAKSQNAALAFSADAENDFQKFYDELGASIEKFNVDQVNGMAKFNAGEINDNSQFNASLENRREEFYKDMQYNIDISNAKWRQDVTLKESEMVFEAAALDVKMLFDITTEAMNQLWDRADAVLDYAWKTGENERERETNIAMAKMQASAQKKSGLMGAIGSIAGSAASAFIMSSDRRLKKNIMEVGVLHNGIKTYRWDWNDTAIELGLDTYHGFGVMADELREVFPEAVSEGPDGYLRVNYGMIES